MTEAAVADWEKEKRQRHDVEPGRPHSSAGTDSQPVQSPNWRAKRRRATSVPEEHERPLKRSRASVDSGYTSTDGDGDRGNEASWALVQSVPENKGEIVLELPVPPGFDPSEYRAISLSQSTLLSQEAPLLLVNSSAESTDQARRHISQRTIPDSQDGFDSLRTQSSVQAAANLAEAGLSEHFLRSVTGGNLREDDTDHECIDTRQTSQSGLSLPSRQPEDAYQHSAPSDLVRISETLPARHSQTGESHPTEESPWSRGFLTQPEFELPLGFGESEPSGTSGLLNSSTGLTQGDRQARPANSQSTTALKKDSFLTATDSNLHFQAAQTIPLLDSNPGLIRTQTQDAAEPDEDEVVPETVQRGRGKLNSARSVSQPPHRTGQEVASSPASNVGSLAGSCRRSAPAPNTTSPRQFPAQTPVMDGPPPEETPRSAVDLMRRLQEDVFGTSPESVPSRNSIPEPALSSQPAILPVLPLIDNNAGHLGGGPTGGAHDSPAGPASSIDHSRPAGSMSIGISIHPEHALAEQHSMEYEQPPTTVAPSDLTASADDMAGMADLVSSRDRQVDGGADDRIPTSANDEHSQFPHEIGDDDEEEDEIHSRDFVVTLPMAANTRSTYLETIAENKDTMIEFGEVFANSCLSLPDAELVAKMDRVFEQLLNLCDLPSYNDTLPELDTMGMMKHATGSNSKFSFVYEFLNGLWDINVRVLILSQPGRVFEYLEAIVSAARFPYTTLEQGDATGQPKEGMSVILAVAGQDLTKIQGGVDVVLAFDHAARSVELPATLGYDSMAPIVLSLVVTYSLEHIDQQLQQQEPDLDGLERKNALNLATAAAKEHLRNPERGYPEPHEAAEMFSSFLRNPEGGLAWEPHPLPVGVFELWLGSQDRQESQNELRQIDASNMSSNRKRRLVSLLLQLLIALIANSVAGRSRGWDAEADEASRTPTT